MAKEIMTPVEAAKILGCSPQMIREHIRHGIWKFGECIPKKKTGKGCDRFVIYRHKLYQHIGITDGEAVGQ